jgi:electron transport complex protein RnfE
MSEIGYRQILENGVWTQNTGFVALLGLCPLLATSNSVVNGLGLGLATTLVLLLSNVAISLIRNLVRPEVRIPVFVMVIACVVTAVELAMRAFLPGLYMVLGIFIPLIVTNCCVIGRAEAFAFKHGVGKSAVDGVATGLRIHAGAGVAGRDPGSVGAGDIARSGGTAVRRIRPGT